MKFWDLLFLETQEATLPSDLGKRERLSVLESETRSTFQTVSAKFSQSLFIPCSDLPDLKAYPSCNYSVEQRIEDDV